MKQLVFHNGRHHPKAITKLLPNGFIWEPFCSDLDQSIFMPRYTAPTLWQICFQMASFGHLSVQIWIKPFSKPETPSQSHGRFASRWLHLDTFLSRSRSSHSHCQKHDPAQADLHSMHFSSAQAPCRSSHLPTRIETNTERPSAGRLSVETPFHIIKMHAGASGHRFAQQKCMPERPDVVLHCKNACQNTRTPCRSIKMHAGASGHSFALQKCMPERLDVVSHYKNACRSVRAHFRA